MSGTDAQNLTNALEAFRQTLNVCLWLFRELAPSGAVLVGTFLGYLAGKAAAK